MFSLFFTTCENISSDIKLCTPALYTKIFTIPTSYPIVGDVMNLLIGTQVGIPAAYGVVKSSSLVTKFLTNHGTITKYFVTPLIEAIGYAVSTEFSFSVNKIFQSGVSDFAGTVVTLGVTGVVEKLIGSDKISSIGRVINAIAYPIASKKTNNYFAKEKKEEDYSLPILARFSGLFSQHTVKKWFSKEVAGKEKTSSLGIIFSSIAKVAVASFTTSCLTNKSPAIYKPNLATSVEQAKPLLLGWKKEPLLLDWKEDQKKFPKLFDNNLLFIGGRINCTPIILSTMVQEGRKLSI